MPNVWEENSGIMDIDFSFTAGEKDTLLRIAKESVRAVVSGKKFVAEVPKEARLCQKAGAFVTLHLHGELRGCIGLIEPRLPLYETVAEMAAKSATSDPRFDSVTTRELDNIEIEISVLSLLEKVEKPENVIVGHHGVMIEKGYFRALLLPQVATENGWNREQLLRQVCVKAGLHKEAYRDPDSNLFVFTAEIFGEESRQKEEKDVAERN